MPADFRVSITNPPGKDAYPIASFTWLLLYEDPDDKAQGRVRWSTSCKWALTDGQSFARDLGYAPLPENVVEHGNASARQREGCSDVERTSVQLSAADEALFRGGTGAFAVLLIVIVAAIGFELLRAIACSPSRNSAGSSGRRTSGIQWPASSAPGRSSGARSIRRSWRC